jgi:hypothetical protein
MATGTGKAKASRNHEASVSVEGTSKLTVENIESDTPNIQTDSPCMSSSLPSLTITDSEIARVEETLDVPPVKQGPG